MRRLNIKFVIILVVLLAVITAAAYLVWAFNVGRSSNLLLEKARVAEKSGDLDKSIRFYIRYLNRNPSDSERLCEAALVGSRCISSDSENTSQAINALRLMGRALRIAPERTDIRRHMIDSLMEIGRLAQGSDSERHFYVEARKEIVKIKSQGTKDVELDYMAAVCSDKLGKIDEAIAGLNTLVGYNSQRSTFDNASARAPDMIKAYVLLAEFYRRRGTGGREDEMLADAVIEQMVVRHSKSSDAYLKRAIYLQKHNEVGSAVQREQRLIDARRNLQTALELDNKNLDALIKNAELLIEEQNFKAARESLDAAERIDPKDPRVYIQQSRISRLEKDTQGELAYLQKGLEILPGNRQLVNLLFTVQLISKQIKEALATIEQMRELRFRPELIALSEAKMMCVEQQWEKASRKLETLRPQMTVFGENMVSTVDHLLGRCYQRLGQPDRQLEVYGRTLSATPRSKVALAGQAEALIALKRMPEALETLTRLRAEMGFEDFDSDAGLRALYLATLASLSDGNPQYRERLEGAKQQYVAREDVPMADKAVIQAEGLVRKGRPDAALEHLAKALIELPDAVRLQNAYLAIIVRERGPAAALEYLKTATTRDDNPWINRPELFLRQVELVALAGGPKQFQSVKDLEGEIANYDLSEQPKLWKKVARTYYHLTPRRREDAKRCLRIAAKGDPDQIYSIGLFELGRETGDELQMQAQIDEAVKRYGKDNNVPKYLEALYLIWQYERNPKKEASLLARADALADQIARTRPRWQYLLGLKGGISDLQGNTSQAIDFFEESLDAGPMEVATVRRLVELLVHEGRFEEARNSLLRLNNVPQSLKHDQLTLDLLTDNREAALASLNQAAPIDSKNPEDWVRRGRVLLRLGKLPDAEKAFRRAVKLAPQLPQPALALVEYLIKMQRMAEAELEIRDIEHRLSEDVVTQAMGQCYAWLGNRMLAEHYLSAAVAENPKNMECEQAIAKYHLLNNRSLYAIPHLNTILEHSVSSGAPADTLALWARRALARVFASLQNHSSFRQALALIEANRKAGQLKSPDLNLKGLILAIRPEPAYRQHGLMILESIAREDLAIEERLALAQLYLSSDRWLECRDIMQALLVDYPTDVRLLTKYVEMLIMREEWRQLKPWLRQLEGRAPTELETVRLAALAAKGRGKERPAAAIVETLIPEGVQAADLEMVLSAAKIYEQLEMHKAAEQAYRAMADRNVQYRMNLAAYLARRGKLDEAFRLCDTLLTKDTVRQICAIGLGSAVRYVRDLTPNQQRTIEKWLAIAKREFPGSIELITQEAALLSAQEKFNEVLQITSKVDQDKLSDSQRGLLANNNAYMNMKLGRDGDSLENINLAFDLLGPRVELLDTRAMVYLSRGDYEKAIQDLKEATLFQVESGIYYFHLALAYQAKGDRGSSQRALDIASNMKFLGDNIGFSEREKYDKLKRWLRR